MLDEVRDQSVAPDAILVRSYKRGRVLHTTPLGAAVTEEYGFPYLHVHRADLVGILINALPESAIRLDSRVTGIDDDGHHCRVLLQDGSTLFADVVIGADGRSLE